MLDYTLVVRFSAKIFYQNHCSAVLFADNTVLVGAHYTRANKTCQQNNVQITTDVVRQQSMRFLSLL